jgi:hypothetical protein
MNEMNEWIKPLPELGLQIADRETDEGRAK